MGCTKIRNIFDEDSITGESFNECFNPNDTLEDDEGNFTDTGRLKILIGSRQLLFQMNFTDLNCFSSQFDVFTSRIFTEMFLNFLVKLH